MSVLPLHPLPDPALGALSVPQPKAATAPAPFGVRLLADGVVAPHAMVQALSGQGRLADQLLGRRLVDEDRFYQAFARHHGIGVADFAAIPPDPQLIDRLGAAACLARGLLPWCKAGDVTVIAAHDPDDYASNLTRLTDLFGPVAVALTSPRKLEAAVLQVRGPLLARASEQTVPAGESCRGWTAASSAKTMLGCMALATAAAIWPQVVLAALLAWTLLMFLATMGLKAAALWLALRPASAEPGPAPIIARLPTVSIIVALYREADIAARLVRRLGRLDYPRNLLDILLVVEESDDQ